MENKTDTYSPSSDPNLSNKTSKELEEMSLDVLNKAMKESPTLSQEVERVYREGIKMNFRNFCNVLINDTTIIPSLNFDKKEIIYTVLTDYIKETYPNKNQS